MTTQPKARRVLLVEGADDMHVVDHLCRHHGGMQSFDFEVKDGFPELKRSIYSEVLHPGRAAMGIVADANSDSARHSQELEYQLCRAGVGLPRRFLRGGTIIPEVPRLSRVGVWLMPDKGGTGQLEDFLSDLFLSTILSGHWLKTTSIKSP